MFINFHSAPLKILDTRFIHADRRFIYQQK